MIANISVFELVPLKVANLIHSNTTLDIRLCSMVPSVKTCNMINLMTNADYFRRFQFSQPQYIYIYIYAGKNCRS